MDKFWIIPMIALVIGFVIAVGTLEYKFNTAIPNGELELVQLKAMTCHELKERNSKGNYWVPENGKYVRDIIKECIKVEEAELDELRGMSCSDLIGIRSSGEGFLTAKNLAYVNNTIAKCGEEQDIENELYNINNFFECPDLFDWHFNEKARSQENADRIYDLILSTCI